MNALPITGELFATNQVSADTERCYKYQLRSFASWMADSRDVHDSDIWPNKYSYKIFVHKS